ncbi:c6 zinc finger domain protein [Rhypophila decipiens]|uniref:C6 zinc finger domain protein n=1 Tax=Rhypophila decipiens TaxID=261697 RepID=A0AAN7B4Y6_9PEZI|nr:c6 zinc finger domain protein [Rhypophila decipiens]
MVGVPGRSKGCNTCRRRKKGCDLARPACGQCRRAGIECAGYVRSRAFINMTDATGSLSHGRVTVAARATSMSHSTVALPDDLARAAYEVRYLELFWDAYMPLKSNLGGVEHVTYVNPPWADAANDLYPADEALRTALLALGLRTIGRRDGHQWMVNEGLGAYVRSLRHVSKQLRQAQGWKSDALLATSKVLGLYELLCGAEDESTGNTSQENSWQIHNTGEQALIIRRSPEMHTRGHAALLFSNARTHIIIVCMVKRQRCPLSTPAWKTVPFTHTPKTYKDALLDVFVDIPGLLENLDALRLAQDPSSSSQRDKRVGILQECWRLDRELLGWFDKYGPRRQIEELRERRFRNQDPSLSDAVTAHIMGIYWAVCILVYSTLQSVLTLHNGGCMSIDEAALPERMELKQYCRHIADIAEVLLHPSTGVFGLHSTALPLGVALRYLNSVKEPDFGELMSPEKRRLLGLLDGDQWRVDSLRTFLSSSIKDQNRL